MAVSDLPPPDGETAEPEIDWGSLVRDSRMRAAVASVRRVSGVSVYDDDTFQRAMAEPAEPRQAPPARRSLRREPETARPSDARAAPARRAPEMPAPRASHRLAEPPSPPPGPPPEPKPGRSERRQAAPQPAATPDRPTVDPVARPQRPQMVEAAPEPAPAATQPGRRPPPPAMSSEGNPAAVAGEIRRATIARPGPAAQPAASDEPLDGLREVAEPYRSEPGPAPVLRRLSRAAAGDAPSPEAPSAKRRGADRRAEPEPVRPTPPPADDVAATDDDDRPITIPTGPIVPKRRRLAEPRPTPAPDTDQPARRPLAPPRGRSPSVVLIAGLVLALTVHLAAALFFVGFFNPSGEQPATASGGVIRALPELPSAGATADGLDAQAAGDG